MLVLIKPYLLYRRKKTNWYGRCESYIEKRLYNALARRGLYVETQIPCGKYRIDLTIPEFRIAIECDGYAFHSSPAQKRHDARKNRYLKSNGWYVIRFTGQDIVSHLPHVITTIEKVINKRVIKF